MPTISGLTDLGLVSTLRELMLANGEYADVFRQDSAAFGALRAISGNIGAVEIGAWTGPEKDPRRERATSVGAQLLENLMLDPDGADVDGGDLIDLALRWFVGDGEAHLVMRDSAYMPVRTPDERPQFLTVHSASEMQPTTRGRRAIAWSLNDDRYTQRSQLDIPDAARLSLIRPDDTLPYRGFGVCRVLGPTGEIGWLAKSYLRSYFKNGADPGGIITLDGAPGARAIKDLKDQWVDRHGGASKANTPAVLTGGATYTTIAKTHQEMQLTEMLRGWQREDVLLAMNVPESELGKADSHTYSNGVSANGQFWNVLFTYMRQFSGAFNNPRKGLGRRFGAWLDWDYGFVKTVLENAASKAAPFMTLVQNGVPINVAKRVVGLRIDDVPGGDVPRIGANMIPLDATATSPAAVGAFAGGGPALPEPNDEPEPDEDEEPEDTEDEPAPEKSARAARVRALRARQRAAQAGAVVKLRRSAGNAYAREFRALVVAMRKEALQQLEKIAADGVTRGPGDPLVDLDKWAKAWSEAVQELVDATLQDAADGVADEIGRDLHVFNLTHPAVVAYAAQKTIAIRSVPETIRVAVSEAMAEGIAANEHPDQLARRLKDVFNGEASRLDAIARTESGEAVSTGRFVAMDVESVTEHEWSAFPSLESRHAGTPLDGEIVKIGESFSNGLRYPLDPAGAAEDVVNCRCVALAVE